MECLTDSRRVVVTKGPYIEPQPTTHNPQPFPATPGANAPPADPDPLTINQRAKRITDAYHAVEPMSKWPAVNAVVIKAIKTDRWADDAIRDALLRLAADNRAVTVDTLRIELGGRTQSNVVAIRAPTNGGRKPSTADQRMADAIALANHFAELDGEAQPP